MSFKHPTESIMKEGTYIVKDTHINQFVYLSEFVFGEHTEIYDHRHILEALTDRGIDPGDLGLERISPTRAATFLDA